MIYRIKRFTEDLDQGEHKKPSSESFIAKAASPLMRIGIMAGGAFAAHRGYLGSGLMKASNKLLYNVGDVVGSKTLMNKGFHGYTAGYLRSNGVLTKEGSRNFYKNGVNGVLSSEEVANASFKNGPGSFTRIHQGITDIATKDYNGSKTFRNFDIYNYSGDAYSRKNKGEFDVVQGGANRWNLEGAKQSYLFNGSSGSTFKPPTPTETTTQQAQ